MKLRVNWVEKYEVVREFPSFELDSTDFPELELEMLQVYNAGSAPERTQALDALFDTYPNSGEVNYKVTDVADVLSKIRNHYQQRKARIYEIDGVSVEFADWRFNLRPSNTEPLLRLNVEAVNTNLVVEKFLEVENFIGAERDNPPALPDLN